MTSFQATQRPTQVWTWIIASLLMVLLASGCLPPDPSDADDAQEAVVWYFAERIQDGPWEVICLSREAGPGQEEETTYLRRFQRHPLPVVPPHRCEAAGEESFVWIVEDTGEVAIEIILGRVRRNLDGSLLVSAGTSTGTSDHSEHDCTLVQHDGAWEVKECVVTITT